MHHGTNEWKILCPIHGDTQQSLFINRENGKWYCFGCSRGSSNFMDLVKKIAEVYDEKVDYRTAKDSGFIVFDNKKKRRVDIVYSDLISSGKDYLSSRGYSLDQIGELKRVFDIKQMRVDGRWFLRLDIKDFNGEFVGWVRRSIDGEKVYLNKTGFDAERYFYGEWVLPENPKKVVIVEGAFDLYKVWLAGYDCLAVINFKRASLKLARLLKRCRGVEIIFFFDADVKNTSRKYLDWVESCNLFNINNGAVFLPQSVDDPGALSIEDIRTYLG